MPDFTRRDFLGASAASFYALSLPRFAFAADDPHAAVQAEIAKRHDEGVARLQDWVRQAPSPPRTRTWPTAATS